jgi:membrane protein
LVQRRGHNLWTLGGLSIPDLLRRTIRESWQDSVFGQGGRMAFYHFLAIFPALLVLLAVSSHVPEIGAAVKSALTDLSGQILPDQVSRLFQRSLSELHGSALAGIHFVSVCAGALWAALNATWAMIYGLNRAYEVRERRSWWKLGATIAGLTLALAVLCCLALFLIFVVAHAANRIVRVTEWVVLIAALLLWFAVLYRFAPNIREHQWRWSTPGAVCALLLWIAAAFAARFYFDRVNDYSRAYGHLNGVVMLLLWLYVSNGAILIGGEMNSEIEKAAAERGAIGELGERSRA